MVSEADLNSGSLRSVEFALKMGKKVYTLPHRIGESLGTQKLIRDGKATPVYDIDEFIKEITGEELDTDTSDEFIKFCKTNPTYIDAIKQFGDIVYEYELEGKVVINNGIVTLK